MVNKYYYYYTDDLPPDVQCIVELLYLKQAALLTRPRLTSCALC